MKRNGLLGKWCEILFWGPGYRDMSFCLTFPRSVTLHWATIICFNESEWFWNLQHWPKSCTHACTDTPQTHLFLTIKELSYSICEYGLALKWCRRIILWLSPRSTEVIFLIRCISKSNLRCIFKKPTLTELWFS